MGRRGPPPKATATRELEGTKPRPLKAVLVGVHPPAATGEAQKPEGMSEGASRIWDKLTEDMAGRGYLSRDSWLSLANLCEDQAALDSLRAGLRETVAAIELEMQKKGRKVPGGALLQLSRTNEGRRVFGAINELRTSVMVQVREFGLTPASRTRVEAIGGAVDGAAVVENEIDSAMFGNPDTDFFVPPVDPDLVQ
jgi:phage terminase small subunit